MEWMGTGQTFTINSADFARIVEIRSLKTGGMSCEHVTLLSQTRIEERVENVERIEVRKRTAVYSSDQSPRPKSKDCLKDKSVNRQEADDNNTRKTSRGMQKDRFTPQKL